MLARMSGGWFGIVVRGLGIGLFVAACASGPTSGTAASEAGSGETSAGASSSGGRLDDSDSSASTSASTFASTGGSTDTGAATTGSPATTETSGTDATGESPVDDAIERGIVGTLALADDDIVLLLLMDAMHRRFDVTEFADAADRYDAAVAELAEVPIDAVAFRRIFDPTQVLTAEELDAIAPGVNRVTVPALFCDVLPWPADYGDLLQQDAALSGYELTHVTLALQWASELGCTVPVDDAFASQVVADTFALVDTSDGVRDLELEAGLFAALLAGPASLPADLVDATIAAQFDDGTWPRDPGDVDGNWHTTGIALFLLLELHRPPLDTFVTTQRS